MTDAPFTSPTTTEAEARDALAPVQAAYGRFDYKPGHPLEKQLIGYLTKPVSTLREAKRNSDNFRNALWLFVAGGGVSASTTRKVYGALGRLDETDDRWI